MEILFCTSEAYPLIKTGGLGDVSGSLPKALATLGHRVRLILPAYPEAKQRAGAMQTLASLTLDGIEQPVQILQGHCADLGVDLYLVDAPAFFQRPGNPYVQEDGSDWPDNAARFALFARAIVALATGAADDRWQPQVVHCNDWQTGLVPALLSQYPQRPATLFTVHNLSYQGLFPADTFAALGLPPALWSMDGVEFYNQLSFLKGGIAYADHVNTVSPTYAREIRTPAFGYGLEGLLEHRSGRLSGILNGIDCANWDPQTDPHIEKTFSVHRLQYKAVNKAALQRELGLPEDEQAMLIGHIGRLVEQKGVDLILEILGDLFPHQVQLAILGSGDAGLERRLTAAAARYPRRLAVHIGYSEPLAHRIGAGSDCFLMPSRYEPCGLNQMYSLRYGCVPIVRRTGGLTDTVIDLNDTSARDCSATGFAFDEDTPQAILNACLRALAYYHSARAAWWKLVISGMQRDFCWARSASQYVDLYRTLCRREAQAPLPQRASQRR